MISPAKPLVNFFFTPFNGAHRKGVFDEKDRSTHSNYRRGCFHGHL